MAGFHLGDIKIFCDRSDTWEGKNTSGLQGLTQAFGTFKLLPFSGRLQFSQQFEAD